MARRRGDGWVKVSHGGGVTPAGVSWQLARGEVRRPRAGP